MPPLARLRCERAAMQPIHRRGGVEAWAARLVRPYAFVSPFAGAEFVLLLLVGDEHVTPREQSAQRRVRPPGLPVRRVCRAHCWSWDDSIDMSAGLEDASDG